MKPLMTSKADNERIAWAKKYFEGRAGVFPEMLLIVLNDPYISEISAKISEKAELSAKEADILVEKYCDEQERYKKLCKIIARWGELNPELLFTDTLGTNAASKIYLMNFNFLYDTESLLGNKLLDADTLKKVGRDAALKMLDMTEDELEDYKNCQRERLLS